MPVIRPFQCVRPSVENASSIAALPYDVYNREEAREAVRRNPLSFLKIDRAETQFPEETDMYSPQVYEQAGKTLDEMLADGLFLRDEEPCYYLYALTFAGRTQTGIVGCASIDDYLNGTIRKHENTKADKEQDRICHVDTLSAQTGPIFLAYRAQPELKQLTRIVKTGAPLYDFTSEDGIRHQIWRIDPKMPLCPQKAASDGYGEKPDSVQTVSEQINRLFSDMNHVYIADGHHRAASAVKVGLKRRKEYPDYQGTEEFNYFLSVLFPDDELKIFDYNRVVTGLNGYTFTELLHALNEKFIIEKSALPCRPQHKGEIALYGGGAWYRLTAHADLYTQDLVRDLDVSILQDHVLEPLLGIRNPRADSRLQFVGGIRGLEELVRLVDQDGSAESRIAFAMFPTSMEELLAVADSGQLMPPKSTWFEPKLRSGLFIHEFEKGQ